MPMFRTGVLLGLGRALGRGARRAGRREFMQVVCYGEVTGRAGGVRGTRVWRWVDI